LYQGIASAMPQLDLLLILSGAALQRCDTNFFSSGFSR